MNEGIRLLVLVDVMSFRHHLNLVVKNIMQIQQLKSWHALCYMALDYPVSVITRVPNLYFMSLGPFYRKGDLDAQHNLWTAMP